MMAYVGLGDWWEDFKRYNSPDAWGTVMADAYSQLRFGDIPAPGAGLPAPPAPAAPAPAQASSWTPELQGAADAANFEQWKINTRQAIQDAIDAGSYHPEGRIPGVEDLNNALDFTGKYGPWMLAGGLGLVLLVVLKGGR